MSRPRLLRESLRDRRPPVRRISRGSSSLPRTPLLALNSAAAYWWDHLCRPDFPPARQILCILASPTMRRDRSADHQPQCECRRGVLSDHCLPVRRIVRQTSTLLRTILEQSSCRWTIQASHLGVSFSPPLVISLPFRTSAQTCLPLLRVRKYVSSVPAPLARF